MSSERTSHTDQRQAEPLKDDEWPSELVDMLPGFAGDLNVYRTMAHHPALLRAWTDIREHIVNHSALGKELLEVVILRTGYRLKSDYEWSQHVVRARRSGLSDERILSLRGPKDAMDDADRTLCEAVDELFEFSKLRPDTLARLVADHGKAAAFDLMATVGFYSTLGFILSTFETPLDDGIRAKLAETPLKT